MWKNCGESYHAPHRADVTTKSVDRLDLFINTRPYRSVDVVDGTTSIDVPGGRALTIRVLATEPHEPLLEQEAA